MCAQVVSVWLMDLRTRSNKDVRASGLVLSVSVASHMRLIQTSQESGAGQGRGS